MKAIHFVFCLCTAVVLSTFSSLAAEEDFKIFLQKALHFSIHASSSL